MVRRAGLREPLLSPDWLKSLVYQHLQGRALTAVVQWVGCRPATRKSLVQLPVRAHAWVVGQVLSWGCVRGN